jgi:transposase
MLALQVEKRKREELERRLIEETAKRDQIIETEVKRREKKKEQVCSISKIIFVRAYSCCTCVYVRPTLVSFE